MSESTAVEMEVQNVEKNLPAESENTVPQSEEKKKQDVEKQDAEKEERIDKAGYEYRKSKKQAWGMFLVACAAVFGRLVEILWFYS